MSRVSRKSVKKLLFDGYRNSWTTGWCINILFRSIIWNWSLVRDGLFVWLRSMFLFLLFLRRASAENSLAGKKTGRLRWDDGRFNCTTSGAPNDCATSISDRKRLACRSAYVCAMVGWLILLARYSVVPRRYINTLGVLQMRRKWKVAWFFTRTHTVVVCPYLRLRDARNRGGVFFFRGNKKVMWAKLLRIV